MASTTAPTPAPISAPPSQFSRGRLLGPTPSAQAARVMPATTLAIRLRFMLSPSSFEFGAQNPRALHHLLHLAEAHFARQAFHAPIRRPDDILHGHMRKGFF